MYCLTNWIMNKKAYHKCLSTHGWEFTGCLPCKPQLSTVYNAQMSVGCCSVILFLPANGRSQHSYKYRSVAHMCMAACIACVGCVCVCPCMCVCTCACASACVCMHACARMCACMNVCVHACGCAHVCMCIVCNILWVCVLYIHYI